LEVYPPLSPASSHPSAHLLNHSAMRSPPTLLTHATAQLLHPAHHAQGTSCLFHNSPPPASPHPPAHLLHDCAHHAQGAYVLTHKQRLAARLTNALACRRTGTNSKADTHDTCMVSHQVVQMHACPVHGLRYTQAHARLHTNAVEQAPLWRNNAALIPSPYMRTRPACVRAQPERASSGQQASQATLVSAMMSWWLARLY
jgi:hypothetical protein